MISYHGRQRYPQFIDTSECAIGFQGIHASPKGDASASLMAHRLHQCELLFIGSSVIMNNHVQTWKNFSFTDGCALAGHISLAMSHTATHILIHSHLSSWAVGPHRYTSNSKLQPLSHPIFGAGARGSCAMHPCRCCYPA